MSTPVTTFPAGIVSLLGLRDAGIAVKNWNQDVVGTLELFELFAVQTREELTAGPTAAAAVGIQSGIITVPAGELWYVERMFVEAATGAGQTISIAPACQFLSGNYPTGPYWTIPQNSVIRAYSDRPFFAGPGCLFSAVVSQLVAGPVNLNFRVTFTRLRV